MDDLFSASLSRHREVLSTFEESNARNIALLAAEVLSDTLATGHTVHICGNGGSAADAQHLSTEWVSMYSKPGRPLPAVALTTNTSTLTAIGNDFGFEHIFSRQIEALGRVGDVLIVISTSGSSKNVVLAADTARSKKMRVIALAGKNGLTGASKDDLVIAIPASETARIQEMHQLTYHLWCEYIEARLLNTRS